MKNRAVLVLVIITSLFVWVNVNQVKASTDEYDSLQLVTDETDEFLRDLDDAQPDDEKYLPYQTVFITTDQPVNDQLSVESYPFNEKFGNSVNTQKNIVLIVYTGPSNTLQIAVSPALSQVLTVKQINQWTSKFEPKLKKNNIKQFNDSIQDLCLEIKMTMDQSNVRSGLVKSTKIKKLSRKTPIEIQRENVDTFKDSLTKYQKPMFHASPGLPLFFMFYLSGHVIFIIGIVFAFVNLVLFIKRREVDKA